MATIITLAQSIETDYSGEISGSVKVCRPDMASVISDTNLPYTHELIGVPDSIASGIIYGEMLVKAQTSLSGDYEILHIGYMCERDNTSSYSLQADGRVILINYKRFYRPFNSESDNLMTHVTNYFLNVRNLLYVNKLDVQIGTPVYGHVSGQRLIGDGGETQTESHLETWVFRASYPWGTSGNIVSWKE